jgi:alpha-tubulin suppressor-like RCC1 family protein
MVTDAISVAAGNTHSCALSRTKTVVCWGMSNYGQAGVAPGPNPVPPTVVAGLADVAVLTAGGDHACAIKADASVWCWGRGDSGQLGFGTTPSGGGLAQPVEIPQFRSVTSVVAAATDSCAIAGGGIAYCWGSNRYGQLGNGTTNGTGKPVAVLKLTGVAAIDAGDHHACAVLGDGSAYCWGSNQWGQLGNGVPLLNAQPRKVALECP